MRYGAQKHLSMLRRLLGMAVQSPDPFIAHIGVPEKCRRITGLHRIESFIILRRRSVGGCTKSGFGARGVSFYSRLERTPPAIKIILGLFPLTSKSELVGILLRATEVLHPFQASVEEESLDKKRSSREGQS